MLNEIQCWLKSGLVFITLTSFTTFSSTVDEAITDSDRLNLRSHQAVIEHQR